ncbi:myosin-7a binding protein isoform 2-T7 [Glossina fuscipes fuscipes]
MPDLSMYMFDVSSINQPEMSFVFSECETEDVDIPAEGCLGFSQVEIIDASERTPSVIEILAAVALAPMIAVPAADQPAALTSAELSTLHELTDLALTEIKTRAGEVTAHDLEVIPEEPNDITLQEEFLIDLKNLPPPPALDDMSTDYIIENLILKPPDEIVELVTYIPIVEPPPEIEQETVESEQTNAKAIALQAGTSSVGEASQLLDTTHSREQTVLHESIAIEENQSVDEIKSNLAQVVEGNSMSLGIEKPAITEEIPEMLEVQQKVINERWSSGDKNEGFQPETVIKTNAKVAKEDLTSSDIIATETSEAILAKVEAEHLLAEEKRDRSSGERISVLQPESLVGTEKEAAEKDLTLPDVNGPPTSETTPVTPDVKDTVAKDKQDRFSEETKSDFQPEFVVKDETEVTETDLASPNVNELASNEAIPLAENTVAQHKQDRSSDKTDSQLESVAKTVIEVTEKDLTSSNIKETATSEAIPATLEVEDTVAHKTQDRSSDETKSNLQAESVVKTETEAGEKDLTSSDINEPATSKGTPPALDAEDMVGQETQDGSSDETISDIQPESVVKTETEVSDKDLTSSDINEPESSEPNPVTLEVEDVVAQQKQDRSSDETKSDIRPDSIAKTETEVAQKDLTSSVINEPASCEATPPTLDAEDTVAQEAQDQASDKTKSNIEAESVVKAETEVSDKDLNSSNINEPESTVTIPTTLEVEDAVVRQKQDRPSDGMKSDIDSIVKTETEVVQKDLTSSDINKPPTSEATPPTVAVEAAAAQEKQDRSSDETKSDIQPESIVKTETEVNDKDMNSTDINEQATNETIEATPEVEGTILKETQDRSSDEKRSDLQPESVAKTETEVSDKDLNSSDINEPESSELIPVTLEVEDVVAQQKQDRFSDGMKSDIQSDSIAKTETEVVQKDLTSSDISEPATSEATPPTVDVEAAAAQEKQGRSSDEANLQPEFVTKTETEVAEKDLTSSDVNELATSEATEATSDAEGTVAQETQDRSSDETISDIQPESVLKTETEVSDKDLTSSDINEPESSEPIPVTLEVEDMIAQQKQDRSSDEMKSDIQSDSIAKTETEIAQKDLTSSDISEPATSEATPPTVDVEAAAAQEKQDRSSDETKLQPEFVTKTETEVAEKDLTSSDVNELPTSEATPATLDVGDTAAQETQDQSSDERKPDLKPAVIARAKVISSDVNNSVTSETTPATVEVKSTVEHEEHVESSDETRSDLRLESTQQTEQKIGDEYITSMGLSGQDKLLESISDISVQALELIREEPKLDESNIASDLESSEIPILEPPAGFNEECETNIAVEEKETNESNVEKIIKENEEKASSEKLLFNMEEKVKSSETIHSTINQLISTENELTFTEKKEAFENEQSRAKINLNLHEELFSVAEQDENLSIKKSRHPSLGVIECQPTIIETFAISFEESTDNAFTDATTDDNLSRETSSCSFVATQRAKGNEDLEESAALKAQEHSTALYTQHTPQEVLEKSKALIGKPEEESKSSEKEAMVLLGPLPHEGSKVGEEAINAQNPSTENQQLNADAQAKETPQVTVEEQSHEERNVNIEMNANSPSPSQDEVIPPPVAFESEYILTNQSCETSAENAVKTVNLLAENSAIKNESIPDNIESSQASITKFETNPENLKVIEEKAEESSQFPQEKTIVEEQAGKLDSTAVSTEIVVPIVDSTMPDTSQKAATTSTIKSNEIIPSADINSTKEGHETRQPSEILPCVGADIQKNVLSDSPNISVVVPAREATTIASHVTTPSTEINSASENRETSQPAETSPSAEAVLHKTVLTDTPDTSVIATQDPDTNSACNETNRSNEVTSANEGQKIIQPSGIEKIGNDENISIALDPEIIQSCASLPGLVALNGTAITEDNVTEPKENVLISICNEKIKDSANSGEEEFVRSTEPLSTSIKIAIQEEILTQQGEKTDENSANISSIESSEATTLTSVINVAGKQTECKNDPIESEIPTVCCQSSTEPASIVKDEKTPIPAKEEIDSTKHLPKTSSEETVVSSSELSNSSATSVNVEESVVSETIVNAFATSNLRALDLEKSSVEQLSTKKEPQTSLEHASMDAIEIGSANLSKEQAPEIPIQEQHTLMKSEISTMALIDSAEREYLKWHNAVDMPNNPYAPEALKKRINGSQERCMDLPNISPGKEANPLEHITKEKLNDETDNKREIEYKRYSRDYYINNVSKSNESPSKSGSAEQYTEGCTTLKATNNSPPPQSNDHQEVLYKAVPAQVTVADDIGSSIENISQKSPKSANTSTSDDTDTVRIYDFKKQETIKVRSEVTPQRSEEEKDKENAMPTADRAKQLNFNRSESVGRGSTPSAFKFLQPKRRLIDPSHVMSLDEDERPLVSPMVDKPVIEKEVAEALPSVKALAKAFLLSSSASQTSQTEKPDTKKAKISPPLVQKKSIGPGKLSSRQEADTNEDATITSDLSSLDTDPSIVEITKDQECEAINNSTATTTTIPAPSAIKSCPSNTNTVPVREGVLKNNIAFFENLKFK